MGEEVTGPAQQDEAEAFSAAMDEALGRAVEQVIDHPVAEPLRLQLLEALTQLPTDCARQQNR